MKPGFVDFRYIPNKPIHFRPPNNNHRLISPQEALVRKLGYETFRPDPILVKTGVENSPPLGTKTARIELNNKLGYELFRSESDQNSDSNTSKKAPLRKKYRRARPFLNGGLGENRTEIANNCERCASHRFVSISLVFSIDPALLPIISEAGIDPKNFNESCVRSYISNLCLGLEWGESIEFSSVLHEKPDRFERDRLHNHITLPGSIIDPLTDERRAIPYISKEDIQRSQLIADWTVEQQLDLQLGREWRLKFPEYEQTYNQFEPNDLPIRAPKSVPITPKINVDSPPDLFPLGSVQLPEISVSSDETEPILFDPNKDLDIDSFGDPDLISKLVDDLFGTEIWAAPTTKVSDKSIEIRRTSNVETDVNGDQFEPIYIPEVAKNTPAADAISGTISVINQPALVPPKRAAVAVKLTHYWVAERGIGAISARIEWVDPTTGEPKSSDQVVSVTTVMDKPFLTHGANFNQAMIDAQSALDAQLERLNLILERDFDQGLLALYQSWFRTMALEANAIERGFFPDVPADIVRVDKAGTSAGLNRLPGIRWVLDVQTGDEYGFNVNVLEPDNAGNYHLQLMRRVADRDNIQRIEINSRLPDGDSLKGSFQALQTQSLQFEHDFKNDPDGAWIKWQPWLKPEVQRPEIDIESGRQADERS